MEIFDSRPSPLLRTTKADIEEFTDFLNSLEVPSGLTHLLSRPNDTLENNEGMLPLIRRSVKAKICNQMM